MSKVKDRISKETRGKQLVRYKEALVRPSVEFSAETAQTRQECHDSSNVERKKLTKSIQHSHHSELKERARAFPTSTN